VGQPVSFVAQNLIFCPLASQKITSVATAMQVIFRLAWAAGVANEMSASIQAGGEPAFPALEEFMAPFLMILGLLFLGGIINFAANIYSAYYVGKTLGQTHQK
jgi:hypothetical protein